MSTENSILTLLVTGQCHKNNSVDEDKAIELLSLFAKKDPKRFISNIEEVIEVGIDGMVMIALAILAAKADEEFLRKNNLIIIAFLNEYGPPKLLEFVELLKSKIFGRGFGSRPQRWIRTVMEEWSLNTLNDFSKRYPKQFYSLMLLTHPRYNGSRGKLIKCFLDGANKKISTIN